MPVLIASAGSIAPTIRSILKASDDPQVADTIVRHGPGGLLAEAIRSGLAADIYISASAQGPEELFASGLFEQPRTIARNRMSLVAAPGVKLDPRDPIAALSHTDLKIGMSTPSADPSGDYVEDIIARIAEKDEALAADIRARTKRLYGDRLPAEGETPTSPACDALWAGEIDLLFSYWSAARAILETVPGSTACLLPREIAPLTEVSACIRTGASEATIALFDIITGPLGRSAFRRNAFLVPD